MEKKRFHAVSQLMRRFKKSKAGATAIEYALLAALIGVTMMTGASCVGEALNQKFSCTAEVVNTGQVPGTC